jgi:hypothetical protein
MEYLIEYKSHYNVGDKVLIQYWYDDRICICEVVERVGMKYHLTHNITESEIKNAPDELVKGKDILDHYRKKKETK